MAEAPTPKPVQVKAFVPRTKPKDNERSLEGFETYGATSRGRRRYDDSDDSEFDMDRIPNSLVLKLEPNMEDL